MTRRFLLFWLFFAFLCLTTITALAADEWLPVSPEDLAMKDFAPIPGAHAVILYRNVERNDKESWEKQYFRIKILDEEGKEHANVETEVMSSAVKVTNLEARTIRPDGTIVPFDGKAVDKVIAKYKGTSLYSKAFTLPDVQVGSIIEYRYRTKWDTLMLYDSVWNIQSELPTRDADFSLHYYNDGYNISWLTFLLGSKPVDKKGTVSLTVHNIPGLEKEEYMPPQKELRARVEFVYSRGPMKSGDPFWDDQAKEWYQLADEFMNKKKAAQNEVAGLVGANDTSEVKLQKIYDRVQKIRNLTYESEKSSKEQQRENLKENAHIEDVLKHGYAFHNQLVRTFVALARAAGFDATLIRVTERDELFFHKEIPKWEQLSSELALVKVDGKERYFDPGTPMCPFGFLSWEDTGVAGMVLDKDHAVWKKTPQPDPAESMQRRTAELQLDRDGSLTGQVTVLFEGQDALHERMLERDSDEAERKQDLEDMFKRWLPTGTAIELGKVDDWNSATTKFSVSAKVTIPNFGAATGKRMMVPISIFPGTDKHPFQHARRIYPVYFRYPYRESDVITIKLPEGLQVETLPNTRQVPTPFAELNLKTASEAGTVTINRDIVMKGYFFQREHYPDLRGFLDQVKSMGDEQAVLRAAK
jgi:hypothetical protein